MSSWRRSSFCCSGNCVEVAQDGDTVFVRDGKDPNGPVLTFTAAEWRVFALAVRVGEFDIDEAEGS